MKQTDFYADGMSGVETTATPRRRHVPYQRGGGGGGGGDRGRGRGLPAASVGRLRQRTGCRTAGGQ